MEFDNLLIVIYVFQHADTVVLYMRVYFITLIVDYRLHHTWAPSICVSSPDV